MLPRRPTLFLALCVCLAASNGSGKRGLRLIINGTTASLGEFPFIVSLQSNGEHFCGGTIVETDVVVTAAHCLRDVITSDISVVAGTNYLETDGESSTNQTLKVSLSVVHPCFKWPHLGSDIALLRLKGSFTFNKWVNATVLPPDLYVTTGKGVIAGWGATHEGGTNSNQLVQATVTLLDSDTCRDYYGDEVDSTNFCAAPSSGTEDACQGDSGGPLICTDGYFCGVISGGVGCGVPDFPGVYTNVPCFTPWIVLEKYLNDSDLVDDLYGANCTTAL